MEAICPNRDSFYESQKLQQVTLQNVYIEGCFSPWLVFQALASSPSTTSPLPQLYPRVDVQVVVKTNDRTQADTGSTCWATLDDSWRHCALWLCLDLGDWFVLCSTFHGKTSSIKTPSFKTDLDWTTTTPSSYLFWDVLCFLFTPPFPSLFIFSRRTSADLYVVFGISTYRKVGKPTRALCITFGLLEMSSPSRRYSRREDRGQDTGPHWFDSLGDLRH
ncbi:hypothetical protein BC629DRAFT_1738729 [Irpex lacteus]|nr:hypothetical protein BC629DRAFT_1738729 [Irpex lacteus]